MRCGTLYTRPEAADSGFSSGSASPSSRRLLIRVATNTRRYVFPGSTGVSMFSRLVTWRESRLPIPGKRTRTSGRASKRSSSAAALATISMSASRGLRRAISRPQIGEHAKYVSPSRAGSRENRPSFGADAPRRALRGLLGLLTLAGSLWRRLFADIVDGLTDVLDGRARPRF